MKKWIFVYFLLCSWTFLFAGNPVCDNVEEYGIYETGCYSFGDEFVFIDKEWPEYDNGEEKPENGTTCFSKFKSSENRKQQKIQKDGLFYIVYWLDQYCCKHQVFRTKETRWGNEDDGYKDFSYYGKFGAFYSECEYQETSRLDTAFSETKLQKPMDEIDILNMTTDFEKVFGSRENAMMKVAMLYSLASNNEIPFKIYRNNGSLKYIGGVHLGFCLCKNGKALDFVKGPKSCK